MTYAPVTNWEAPAPWVNYVAQCAVLDHQDGKLATCAHRPRPVFAGDIHEEVPPVIYDADDTILRCLPCFTKAWALRGTSAPEGVTCARCENPGKVYRAATVGYPNLFTTVTACPDHGPGGKDW